MVLRKLRALLVGVTELWPFRQGEAFSLYTLNTIVFSRLMRNYNLVEPRWGSRLQQ